MAYPSKIVLEAFGLKDGLKPLPGGQGESFHSGNAVLKPAHDPIEAEWSAQVFSALASSSHRDFHVPTPILASNSQFVFQGWAASEFVAGRAGPGGKWVELMGTSRFFHAALQGIPNPDFLSHRSHPWAVADQVAWGEASVDVVPELQCVYQELLKLRKNVKMTSQIVHGDLTGNMLFRDDGTPPTVIDFSPFWRPVEYAEAIVIVDGILDHDQGRDLVKLGGTSFECLQMLVRALIFRLVARSRLVAVMGEVTKEYAGAFERAVLFIS
ncbi:uncharacterized protein BP5553_00949 [Venustampulla echinocandica]|uniref:Aminoglycoside phosphotransferase domain-containing protein n=1 Tax=Venustampulla echinocandica TaxID=2656787 RepID=A0A370TZP4_9HELO|nr:uncharacterized protein BP5553_00949 [Venustampulla echinocandica]RDL40970.1 hypothetical protein BP5553_00949 [Venustampulla echinocandica]